jgi:hypothetical protein
MDSAIHRKDIAQEVKIFLHTKEEDGAFSGREIPAIARSHCIQLCAFFPQRGENVDPECSSSKRQQ